MSNAKEENVRLGEKIAYGFGDFASCLYWKIISDFIPIFYTDVFGISASAAGTMMGLSRTADAFVDPMVGMLGDRTNTRWGKFRPYLLWGCVPLALVAILAFTVPNLAENGKLIWAYITFNALMIVYTIINIPYTAMLGVLSPNANDRTTLSSIKFVGAFAGGIVIGATFLQLTKVGGWLGAKTPQQGSQLTLILVGIVAVLSFLVVFFFTRERLQPPKNQKSSVLGDLGDLMTNRPWIVLLLTTIAFIFFVALRGGAETYYFKYYVGTRTLTLPFLGTREWDWNALVSAFKTSNQILSLLGALLVPLFVKRVGSRPAFIILFIIAILATGAFYFISPDQLMLMFIANAIGSITGGPLSPLLWVMYADTADYAEWKTGRAATGLVFSASIFAQKFGWGWGGSLSLKLLGYVGFAANQDQTPGALAGIVKLMSIFPAAFGILALVILLGFYPLTEAKMMQISADLKERRAGHGPAPAPA